MENGCVHIYTGDGKGKTTAAVGLAARAAGQGLRVGFCQFLKSGTSGELAALQKLGVQVYSPAGSGRFLWEMDEEEKAACRRQQQTLARAGEMARTLDVLVLDEAVCALAAEMLAEEELVAFVRGKPAALELVLTGRGAGPALVALADYVTEMKPVAHPYEKGMKARKGIEY